MKTLILFLSVCLFIGCHKATEPSDPTMTGNWDFSLTVKSNLKTNEASQVVSPALAEITEKDGVLTGAFHWKQEYILNGFVTKSLDVSIQLALKGFLPKISVRGTVDANKQTIIGSLENNESIFTTVYSVVATKR